MSAYGLGVGLGVGCAYVPAIGAVQRWFVRRRGFASGLAVSGIGVGTLVMPPLASLLIESSGMARRLSRARRARRRRGRRTGTADRERSRATAALVPTVIHCQPGATPCGRKGLRWAKRSARAVSSASMRPA